MSTQQQGPSSSGTVIAPAFENPPCPICRRRMVVRQVMPVMFASRVDDIIYGCEKCGAEVKRTVKRA